MMTDVPLGAFLSGGIDSSAVVALMQLQSQDRINTFNLSFTEKEFDESPFAETIVQRFDTRHRKHILQSDEYLSQITAALDAMDSPSMDGVNTYVLSTAIRQSGIKVAMTGIGGDELFVGYPGFFQYKKMMASKKGLMFSQWGRKGMSIFLKAKRDNRSHRMAGVLSVDQLSIDQLYPSLRTVLSDFHLHQYTRLETNRKGLQKMLKEDLGNANGWGDFSTYSMAEYLGYTQKTLLKDADQMSMAVGLEVREPFFDHELVEFVLSLPDEMKYPHYPKQLLVEALDPLLPAEIVHRKKQGFVLPWEHWMKKELQSFCTAAINNIAERDFINGEALRNHWKRFQMGDPAIHWTEPWLFVVLSNWLNKQGVS
jgi:asparagine synthase (glutamine-hydrolysing)